MVNHDNNKIISMISSRDMGEVSMWLKKFPNLKVITRDGSILYKSAIELANPNIVQVSDRFHLIKGLSDAINLIIRNMLPRVIVLETIKKDLPLKTLKEKYNAAKTDIESGLSFLAACEKNNITYKTMKKLFKMNELEINEYFTNKGLEKRIERLDVKNQLINSVKDLYKQGLDITTISKKLSLSRTTVSKYLKENKTFTIENTSRVRVSKCSEYHKEIIEMVLKGVKIKEIYRQINSIGYTGKYGLVKHYVNKIKESEEIKYELVIKRKDVSKLIFNNINVNSTINRELLNKLYKQKPEVKILLELVKEFKGILLKTRK